MLSIVIPTHNRTDLLRACLQAVTRHAPGGTEVVVVDDASPGAAASAVAASFDVRAIRLKRQRGFAVAANTGIRASHGDVVEMLNDDTEVQPGWADAALAWFDDPKVGAVAPLVLAWPDGTIIDSAGDRYYLGGIASKRGHGVLLPSSSGRGADLFLPSPSGRGAGGEGERLPSSGATAPECEGAAFLQPCRVFGANGAAGFYRRSALDRVGLFPEEFGSYFEDVDLAFRLNRGGYHAMYEPTSRVLHHISASYGRVGRKLIERQSCNEERVFWRNLPTSVLWRALPKHAAVLLGKAWRRLDEGTILAWLFGRLRVAWEWREIVCRRGPLVSDHDADSWTVEEMLF